VGHSGAVLLAIGQSWTSGEGATDFAAAVRLWPFVDQDAEELTGRGQERHDVGA
jgi:hypothetical protein